MGLTIHYKIRFKGNEIELLKKLNHIQHQCINMGFEEVAEIQYIKYSKEDYEFYSDMERRISYPNNSRKNIERVTKILKQRGIDRDAMLDFELFNRSTKIKEVEMIKFYIWAGKGCESTTLNFFKKGGKWHCRGFTKTEYAADFIKCHSMIIETLDLFKNEGFELEVEDEADYYKTRDYKQLEKH